MIKVSIIIPTYNSAKYLSMSIDSCLSQTFNDYEIIIVNDGSTDNTVDLVMDYVNRYNNVFLVNKSNGGLVSARKYGVKYAKGQYLFFLDADDKISSDALKLLYEHSSGYDIIIGDFVLENQRGELLPIQHKNRNFFYGNRYAVLCNYLSKHVSASLCGRLIKKELLNEFSTPNDITAGEDFITNLIIAKNFPELKTYILNEPLYHYIQYSNSMINSVSSFALQQRIKYINWVINNISSDFPLNDGSLRDTLSYFVLEEYYSFLRDGGDPNMDKRLYNDVFTRFWCEKALSMLREWRSLMLRLYKFSPFCGRILRFLIYKTRLILK